MNDLNNISTEPSESGSGEPAKPWANRNRLVGIVVTVALLFGLLAPAIGLITNVSPARAMSRSVLGLLSQLTQVANKSLADPEAVLNVLRNSRALSYEVTGASSTPLGVDVSEYQGRIDWPAVKDSGIEFAFIRVGARGYGSGRIITDSRFVENIENAKKAGIKIGVYFFSQAINQDEAIEEADFVLGQLKGRALDYPVVYDLESVSDDSGRVNQLTDEQRSLNADAFCQHIEAAGYTALVYGNTKDLARYDSELLSKRSIWYAEYNVYRPSQRQYDFSIWQFTSSGIVRGIETYVDLDVDLSGIEDKRIPDNVLIHEPPG